ncbi:MAG: hypothetical protein NVS4B2_26740 [Chloroflexota bacterium]
MAAPCFACGKTLHPSRPVTVSGYPGLADLVIRLHPCCTVALAGDLLAALRGDGSQRTLLGDGPRQPRPADDARQDPVYHALVEGLTPFELNVLDGLVRGETNPQIARRLERKHKTVRNAVSSVLLKLEADSRTAAAVMAVRAGLFQDQDPRDP